MSAVLQRTLPLMAATLLLAPTHARAWAHETPAEAEAMADSLFQGQFAIDDADPEASVPTLAQRAAAPLDFGTWLMEVEERAQRASDRGELARAIPYYRAIAKAVPDRAISHAQLCDAYERAGALDSALPACAQALRADGARVDDFAHYIKLVLAQPGSLSAQRVDDVDRLLTHLQDQHADATLVAQLRCDVGVRLLDSTRLASCTSKLHELAPDSLQTIGYEWALALQRRDHAAAAAIVEHAKRAGMKQDALRALTLATEQLKPLPRFAALTKHLAKVGLALSIALTLIVTRTLVRARSHRRQRSTLI